MEEITTANESGDEMSTDLSTSTEMVASSATGETPATPELQKSSDTTDELQRELAQLKAALKKANAESKEHRLKAKELDALKAEAEAAKLSETEKLQKKIETLQAQYDTVHKQSQERIIHYEVRLQAAQLGITDPNDAVKLLDWTAIDYDETGTPTNVEELLRQLIKAKPYLANVRSQPSSGGATNPSRTVTTNAAQAITPEFIQGLTTEKYRQLSPEQREKIQEFMVTSKRTRR